MVCGSMQIINEDCLTRQCSWSDQTVLLSIPRKYSVHVCSVGASIFRDYEKQILK